MWAQEWRDCAVLVWDVWLLRFLKLIIQYFKVSYPIESIHHVAFLYVWWHNFTILKLSLFLGIAGNQTFSEWLPYLLWSFRFHRSHVAVNGILKLIQGEQRIVIQNTCVQVSIIRHILYRLHILRFRLFDFDSCIIILKFLLFLLFDAFACLRRQFICDFKIFIIEIGDISKNCFLQDFVCIGFLIYCHWILFDSSCLWDLLFLILDNRLLLVFNCE